MNSGPLLFLGLFVTVASSFWGLLLAPHLQIGRAQAVKIEANDSFYPSARPGLAREGAEVYRSLGCVECHSQQVRQTGIECEVRLSDAGTNLPAVLKVVAQLKPQLATNEVAKLAAQLPVTILEKQSVTAAQTAAKDFETAGARAEVVVIPTGADIARKWGQRRTVAQDYLHDYPVLLGSQRIGPDLANIGSRATNAVWHFNHLWEPKSVATDSMMPRYKFLFDQRKLKKGRAKSADALVLDGTPPGEEVVPRPEAKALVAYLMSLQSDVPLFEAPRTVAKAVVPEAAVTNAPLLSIPLTPPK